MQNHDIDILKLVLTQEHSNQVCVGVSFKVSSSEFAEGARAKISHTFQYPALNITPQAQSVLLETVSQTVELHVKILQLRICRAILG